MPLAVSDTADDFLHHAQRGALRGHIESELEQILRQGQCFEQHGLASHIGTGYQDGLAAEVYVDGLEAAALLGEGGGHLGVGELHQLGVVGHLGTAAVPVAGQSYLGEDEVEVRQCVEIAGNGLAPGTELFCEVGAHLVLHFLRLEAELLRLLHALGVLDALAPFGQLGVVGGIDVEMGDMGVLRVETGHHLAHLLQREEGALDGSEVLGDGVGEDGRLLDFEQLDIIQHLAALQHGEGRADVVDLVQLVAQVRQLGAVGVVVDNGGGGLHQVEFRTQRVGIRAKRQVQQIMPP